MATELAACGCGPVALAALAALCAGFVLLGSLAFGTTREWGADPVLGNDGSGMREGAGRWAGWTFLYGLAAIGPLALAAWVGLSGHPRVAAALAALAIPPFALAALLAGRHRLRLLAEQDRERDYVLTIAAGLPVVTFAGAAGAVVTLLIVGLALIRHR